MAKTAPNSDKYVIEARLESEGRVEKPDVVGAIFGQTEGLLDEELDLRQLQERGRIGRIQVEVDQSNASSTASIRIPSSLDAADTAIVAAALETIERVGPAPASIEVDEISDRRVSKRDYIAERAKQLLEDIQEGQPERSEITSEVKQEVRADQLALYKGFEAGPEAETSDEVVLVEGRADLIKLMKHGVKNAVALGGASVPDKIKEVAEGKQVTAFLDGDRGADLILKELKQKIGLEKVARAPDDREVEELSKKQINSALRDARPELEELGLDDEKRKAFKNLLGQLEGGNQAYILDRRLDIRKKLPLKYLDDELERCHAVVLDGEIDRETAEKLEGYTEFAIGTGKDGGISYPGLRLLEKSEL